VSKFKGTPSVFSRGNNLKFAFEHPRNSLQQLYVIVS